MQCKLAKNVLKYTVRIHVMSDIAPCHMKSSMRCTLNFILRVTTMSSHPNRASPSSSKASQLNTLPDCSTFNPTYTYTASPPKHKNQDPAQPSAPLILADLTGRASLSEPSLNPAQRSAAQRSAAQHSTAQQSTAQHSTAQHSTAQHSTAQHSTAQHSTAQHSTAQHTLHSLKCSTTTRPYIYHIPALVIWAWVSN